MLAGPAFSTKRQKILNCMQIIRPSGSEDDKTMGFTQTKPRASSATRQTSPTVTTSVKEKGKAAKGTEPSPPKMQLSNRYDALKDKDD
ncbi:hypothetical protein IGI04_027182 [Brassica rapa subsp. trilocularis]|uniref:Uncharacterized protein n=1 Tax=Brassica rapa subsp. trilocularis TaxID=1813537 RepID=A0ABQ7L0L7_BRACM|nr:hypothetical protein IGI04_027182 [Brassica rapa subsp. trilocularis]